MTDTCVFGEGPPLPNDETEQTVTPSPAADELRPGACIHGKYTVHGVLGHGGFAVVYDAEHSGLGRRVAIKVLHLRPDTPLALLERFRREARISALVRHPNVLEVYDTGQLSDGSPYLVMERVNGGNLAALIAQGALPVAQAVEIVRQLATGLAAIGDAGIVHRDVKPDNVMLHDPGEGSRVVKLVDFGISKRVTIEPEPRLTYYGALVGTPQYMSPEQIRGEEVDVRTDVYATGAVLYEALTGKAPHESRNFSELVVSVLNAPVQPLRELRPNCPVELEQIVLKALSRQRDQRHASARELLEALDDLVCAYDLPTGDEAFQLREVPEPTRFRPARSSLSLARRLLPLGRGDARAWRLGLLAAALAAPASLLPWTVFEDGAASSSGTPPEHAAHGSAPGHTSSFDAHAMAQASLAPSAPPPRASLARMRADLEEPPISSVEPAPSLQASVVLPHGEPAPVLARKSAPREVPPTEQAPAVQQAPATQAAPPSRAREASGSPVVDANALKAQRGRGTWEQTMQAALAALVRGRLEAAKEHYAQAVRLEPREPTGFRGLGLVAARLGQNREAREALRQYLTLAPNAADRSVIAARLASLPE